MTVTFQEFSRLTEDAPLPRRKITRKKEYYKIVAACNQASNDG